MSAIECSPEQSRALFRLALDGARQESLDGLDAFGWSLARARARQPVPSQSRPEER